MNDLKSQANAYTISKYHYCVNWVTKINLCDSLYSNKSYIQALDRNSNVKMKGRENTW